MVSQAKQEVNWNVTGIVFPNHKSHHFSCQSYLKERNNDGPHHDKGKVENGPENQRDRQAPCFCKLLNVCEGSEVKDKSGEVDRNLSKIVQLFSKHHHLYCR